MTQNTTINPLPYKLDIGKKAFIFGGAYGNLQATETIIKKATELGFESSEIIFTGDMIAYCANPVETVELIKASVDHIIMGNCEEAIANNSSNCGCGFEKGSECSILSNQWYNFCLSNINSQTANWMGSLPRQLIAQIGQHNLLVTHATPHSINKFIFPSTLANEDYCKNIDGYIVGHSGIPFLGATNNKPWLNTGASGMPANDGTRRIWFATIEADENQIFIENHALEYNFQDAQFAMQSASLNNGYMECLASGIWPSHDVLPDTEKKQTGIALLPQKKAFRRTPFKETVLA